MLAGAFELLRAQIPIVSEYWTYGLHRANALDGFHELLLDARPMVVDLAAPHRRAISAAELPMIGASSRGVAFTDLLLLPTGNQANPGV